MRVAGVKAGVSVTVAGASVTVDKLNARRVVSTVSAGAAELLVGATLDARKKEPQELPGARHQRQAAAVPRSLRC